MLVAARTESTLNKIMDRDVQIQTVLYSICIDATIEVIDSRMMVLSVMLRNTIKSEKNETRLMINNNLVIANKYLKSIQISKMDQARHR